MDPSGTDTMTRGAPPGGGGAPPGDGGAQPGDDGVEVAKGEKRLADRILLDDALEAMVAENRSRAMRLDAVSEFHARRVAEVETRGSGAPGFFVLTPLQATKVEFCPLLGIGELMLQFDLELTDGLKQWFPRLWRRCMKGRLDIGRARLAYDQLLNLTNDADKAAFAELIEEMFDRMDDPASPLYPVSRTTLQRAIRRRCLKFPQKSEDDNFGEAFKKRRVKLETDENGMGSLSVSTAVHDAMTADYRLTLIAKKLGEAKGETRTLDQRRADVCIDLILGRLTVGATDGELEDDSTGGGDDPAETFERKPVGRFARPIINVTVPITTLMGLSDEPGVMAGGTSLPADVTRHIATDPDATWYRLLTDPAGGFLELSTKSYTPTDAIWRWTVACNQKCIWPGCCRPATVIELDHRIRFPLGKTSTCNLQPLCRRHHHVKHSEGFSVVLEADGSYTWTSRFGSTFRTPAPEYPIAVWPEDLPAPPTAETVEAAAKVDLAFRSIVEREFEAVIVRCHS